MTTHTKAKYMIDKLNLDRVKIVKMEATETVKPDDGGAPEVKFVLHLQAELDEAVLADAEVFPNADEREALAALMRAGLARADKGEGLKRNTYTVAAKQEYGMALYVFGKAKGKGATAEMAAEVKGAPAIKIVNGVPAVEWKVAGKLAIEKAKALLGILRTDVGLVVEPAQTTIPFHAITATLGATNGASAAH